MGEVHRTDSRGSKSRPAIGYLHRRRDGDRRHLGDLYGPLADDVAADDSTEASLSWTIRIPDSGLETPQSPRAPCGAHHR